MRKFLRTSPKQRGAAALEFALTVPLLLALFAGTIYIGLAILARIELSEAATQAVRACVLQQAVNAQPSAYRACAEAQFGHFIAQYSNVCDGGAARAEAHTNIEIDSSLPASAGASEILLVLQVSCNKRLSPLLGVGGGGRVPGAINLNVTAGMPFVSPRKFY